MARQLNQNNLKGVKNSIIDNYVNNKGGARDHNLVRNRTHPYLNAYLSTMRKLLQGK